MPSYRSKMRLSLGQIIAAEVDLHSVIPTSKTGTRMLCGIHTQPVKQYWMCENPELNHPISLSETVRGVENGNGWTIQTTAKPTVDASKAIDLTPIPVSELANQTFDGEAIYYLTPSSPASNQVWSILANVVKKNKVALVAKLALGSRSNEKMWQLQLFRGALVLRELVYPENIQNAPSIPDTTLDKKMAVLVDQFVENLITQWDKFDSTDPNIRRFDAWMSAGQVIAGPDVQVKEANPQDLLDTLRAAVEANKKVSK